MTKSRSCISLLTLTCLCLRDSAGACGAAPLHEHRQLEARAQPGRRGVGMPGSLAAHPARARSRACVQP